MRIVAGKYKSRVIEAPNSKLVRPTSDRVREAIFSVLFDRVDSARVLDLFCGSGALGIEAVSRGAKEVVFVDKNYDSINTTKQNLILIKENQRVIKSDYKKFLLSQKEPFDIIFVDPPYASGYYLDVLKTIYENKLLSDRGIIVCEHSLELPLNQEYFEVKSSKKYGTTSVEFLVIK